MPFVVNDVPFGLTVWYDVRKLREGAPASEALCFSDRGERDARAGELRALPSVCDVSTWDADAGYERPSRLRPHALTS